jgi:hypothetical protein
MQKLSLLAIATVSAVQFYSVWPLQPAMSASAPPGIVDYAPVNQEARLRLVQELVELPYSYNVLDSKYYKLLDSRDIAAALIERQRRFLKRWQKPVSAAALLATDFPTTNDVEVLSMLPVARAAQIIEHGQLNLHQVSTKNAPLSSLQLRAQVEDLILNIRLEPEYSSNKKAPSHFLRPKYGCVHFLKPSGVTVNPNRWLGFGELLVVYRDSVKQRMTYTYGDSHCRIAVETATIKHPSDPAALADLSPPDDKHRQVPYTEAQIWGAIDMADVAEFRIPDDRKELADSLKPAGLPIYTYDRQTLESIDQPIEESTVPVGRLHCVFSGNPEMMKHYEQIAAQRQIPNLERL